MEILANSTIKGRIMRIFAGKFPREILEKTVLKHLGYTRKEVILGPTFGEDGAITELGDKVLISSVDPITGAIERIGWLAVNICANDVATFGVRPTFFSSCILLPENSDAKLLEKICIQIDEAAKQLEIAVIGGHSEVTPGIANPIVVGYCAGVTDKDRYVTSGGAKPGDLIILTKKVGMEGTAILAIDCYEALKTKVKPSILESAQEFFKQISVVKEAILAFEAGGVTAMHDPTEGGVAGGVHEMADASGLGVRIFEEKISIAKETMEICRFFRIDPLQLISSGALLIAADSKKADEIIEILRRNKIEASVIGEFLPDREKRVLITKNGSRAVLVRPEMDHLWLALEKCRSQR